MGNSIDSEHTCHTSVDLLFNESSHTNGGYRSASYSLCSYNLKDSSYVFNIKYTEY